MKIRNRVKELRMVPAKDLLANPKNWRDHPEEQRSAMRQLLERIGFAGANMARETPEGLQLIDGHLRKELADESIVPVLIVDVTEAEADEILATFDPIASMATANSDKLRALTESLTMSAGPLLDMIKSTLSDACQDLKPDVVAEDAPPAPLPDPVSKTGDLWLLGEHRLLCGDSTKAEDVGGVMGGKIAGLSFTSPPYANQRTYTNVGDLSTEYLSRFIGAACAHVEVFAVNLGLARHGGKLDRYWDDYILAAESCGLDLLSWNVWSREGMQMSIGQATAMFPIQHEWILVLGKKPVALKPTVPNKSAGHVGTSTNRQADGSMSDRRRVEIRDRRELGTVITIPQVKVNGEHPAQFPAELAAAYIEAFDGIVYEPFSGSGTTIIAAEQLARKCYAIEIEPRYVDVAIRRWSKLTGKDAILEGGKRTFQQIAKARGVTIPPR